MPKSPNQKLKILYVMRFLLRESDEEHPVSISRIREYLAQRDIAAERKSIYDDIECLRMYGMDIIQTGNRRSAAYYVAGRTFELPELKLLVDSVQSSRFITRRKTAALIAKIETLASIHEAELLQRQVYVQGRIKTMNESIYYNIDAIQNGISRDRQIRFRYFTYSVYKERRYRKNGAFYVVSPFAMTWDNANYYLVAYDAAAGIIKHYRVDRMTDIETTEEERQGLAAFEKLDISNYTGKVFGMFSGEETWVRMRFADHLVGAVLDRLGHDRILTPEGEDSFTLSAQVVPSPRFFAWVYGFGPDARILAPDSVVAQMREFTERVAELYRSEDGASENTDSAEPLTV